MIFVRHVSDKQYGWNEFDDIYHIEMTTTEKEVEIVFKLDNGRDSKPLGYLDLPLSAARMLGQALTLATSASESANLQTLVIRVNENLIPK
jgi:hypothetical protein